MVNRIRWAVTKAGAKGFASYAGASIPGGSPNARGAESSKTGWLARCLAAVAVASVVLTAVIGTAGTSFRRTRDADGQPPRLLSTAVGTFPRGAEVGQAVGPRLRNVRTDSRRHCGPTARQRCRGAAAVSIKQAQRMELLASLLKAVGLPE